MVIDLCETASEGIDKLNKFDEVKLELRCTVMGKIVVFSDKIDITHPFCRLNTLVEESINNLFSKINEVD